MTRKDIKISGSENISDSLSKLLARNGIELQIEDGDFQIVQDELSKLGYRLAFNQVKHKATGKERIMVSLQEYQTVDHIFFDEDKDEA